MMSLVHVPLIEDLSAQALKQLPIPSYHATSSMTVCLSVCLSWHTTKARLPNISILLLVCNCTVWLCSISSRSVGADQFLSSLSFCFLQNIVLFYALHSYKQALGNLRQCPHSTDRCTLQDNNLTRICHISK